jgi:beta-lactamase regulating signal transducer with metallopeptidase domain
MNALTFLVEWAVRSSILILSGALLLWALRVKDPAVSLFAWTAMLFTSLAIPALTPALPKVPVGVPVGVPVALTNTPAWLETALIAAVSSDVPADTQRIDWVRGGVALYLLVAFALLLRLSTGLIMSLRLLGSSRPSGQMMGEIEVRESNRISAPVTLGIWRPAIVLPRDWRGWDAAKLDAVLAHEVSHIRRYDPGLQVLSAIHRALLWHSPMSWFLHNRIVRAAEEASDDAAVALVRDRAFYGEVLMDFMKRGRSVEGLPMARYGRVEDRIHRILEGTAVSRGVTRWSAVAILAVACPLAYVTGAARPQNPPSQNPSGRNTAQAATPSPAAGPYLNGLGTVAPSYTVVIKPRVDGQLMSMNFKEGDTVQAGQLVASIDPHPYELQLAQAQGRNDQAGIAAAKLQLAYTKIVSPITGVAGLRLIDPGNLVHGGDVLVVITQVQPIAVLFTIPGDNLARVLERRRTGAAVTVEAWSRDDTVRLATGHLSAVDNQIDQSTGTAKLKAEFENKDRALFPNQFVNVRMLL